jgi:hypothetical protein
MHTFDACAPPRSERGAALLLTILLVIIGVGLFVVGASQEAARTVQSERRLAVGLSETKEALVAYAVSHPTRPGALPCPDTDNDGQENITGAACTRYLGRLPWRTLGIGDARDENGERYWYALSNNFHNFSAINSDTKGNRTVHSGTAAVTQTAQAVAVVFAPGSVISGQARDPGVAACATTGTAIPRNECATNYLDAAGGSNNALPETGPYIAAAPSAAFNDRLIVLRTSDLIPLVERRVAADLNRVLVTYRETSRLAILGGGCNCYPWPDSDNDINGTSNTGNNKGRIPLVAAPHNWGAIIVVAGTPFTLPVLPPYFPANNWRTAIYYVVGRNALENFGLAPTLCTTCTADALLPPPTLLKGTLSLDQSIGHAVVLLTPGSAGASRPSANWGDYIDDSVNRDADDRFMTPASKSLDRDRIYTIPDDLPPASCNTNAKTLIYHAPCHTTGTNVKPVCAKAANNLQFCTMCSGEATVMTTPPCRNTLNPPECEAAVATLQGCKL